MSPPPHPVWLWLPTLGMPVNVALVFAPDEVHLHVSRDGEDDGQVSNQIPIETLREIKEQLDLYLLRVAFN